jgi:hypothetical protein
MSQATQSIEDNMNLMLPQQQMPQQMPQGQMPQQEQPMQ